MKKQNVVKLLVNLQFVVIVINIFIGCFSGIYLSQYVVTSMGNILGSIFAGLLTWLIIRALNEIALSIISFFIMKNLIEAGEEALKNQEQEIEENDTMISAKQVDIRIVNKSPPLGKYMDSDIFEWIDIDNGSNIQRLHFAGTIQMNDGKVRAEDLKHLGAGLTIVPPGIIYQVEQV